MFFQAPSMPQTDHQEIITMVSRDTTTDVGGPVRYLSTPAPEVSSVILTLPPGGKTDWMTHPVPGYIYILEGELTVEFEDGHRLHYHAGQAFMQAHTQWHRGINEGKTQMRFLAVFFGEKGTPVVLHPPKTSH
ncbi:cupin domain-containing protein [Pseudacidobacterium ailaaui]|jgi:quercetin dioxygenase-like cupin family protein|uniref:cupin domain-containing protein n=1 Tax=Pseudacidobacterium ailaaui TaxID=1382359 RepID=UPI0005D2CA0D|nr:cupin domain-containing protein [Pseudacidobacterium ailaaui]